MTRESAQTEKDGNRQAEQHESFVNLEAPRGHVKRTEEEQRAAEAANL